MITYEDMIDHESYLYTQQVQAVVKLKPEKKVRPEQDSNR